MKIVGLKIEKGHVSASVVMKRFGKTELVDFFSSSFSTDAELIDILKEKAGAWAGAMIVSSIPGRYFSQRVIKFPFHDRRQVEKALPFEIEDAVPFPLEEVVIDHMLLSKPDKKEAEEKEAVILALMLPKAVLKQHLAVLESAGLQPQVIVPSYAGLYHIAMMMNTEGRVAIVSGLDICVKDDGRVAALRHVLGPEAMGVANTIRAIEAGHRIQIEKLLTLTQDGTASGITEEIGIPAEVVLPEFYGKKPADPVSLGLALVEHVNLRKGEFAYRRADEAAVKKRRAIIIAAAAAAFLGIVNIGVKYALVQSAYARLEKEMSDIYRRTFPESKAKGDFVKLMRTGIEDMNRKIGAIGTGASALDLMKLVTEGVPKEVRVSFQEFNLDTDRLRLSGEAGSFEAVDRIKAELQKAEQFSEVTVSDTRMGVDNKVKFRLDIKLRQAM